MDRSGPVPAAVRAAGYLSEEEEEEEDGSSVEEEDDEEEEEEEEEHVASSTHHTTQASSVKTGDEHSTAVVLKPESSAAEHTGADEAAPGYEAPAAGSDVKVGSNGYVTEKKDSKVCFHSCCVYNES